MNTHADLPASNDDPRDPSSRVHFVAYDDAETWARASADLLADTLRTALDASSARARLLLSGGTTPAPVYRDLSHASLDWSRVDVGLVDERWLQPDDADSNARLVRETLLQHDAAAARFETMTRAGRTIEDVVSTANLHAQHPPTALTLGMGGDGHTASLFPHMQGLQQALANPNAYTSVDASGCVGAGKWSRRISLTPAGLAPAGARLLLIRGADKRALFERALQGDDVRELPVRLAFLTPGAPLVVHWCV